MHDRKTPHGLRKELVTWWLAITDRRLDVGELRQRDNE